MTTTDLQPKNANVSNVPRSDSALREADLFLMGEVKHMDDVGRNTVDSCRTLFQSVFVASHSWRLACMQHRTIAAQG